MRYLSLFSGIGGFELGITRAFAQKKKPICIGYSEIDPYAIKVYQAHFPTHKNLGDIRAIKTHTLPRFSILVGGFPCQTFSIAGRRQGFADPRGTLFFEIVRILKAKRPRYFVLENVKGLLSHASGCTFRTIIATLEKLGYCVQWSVCNSTHFGIPHNRERVFIVGHRGRKPRTVIFPLHAISPKDTRTHSAKTRHRHPVAVANSSTREFAWRTSTAPTLCAGDCKNRKLVRIGKRIRYMTPIEAERLQGFPDGWTKGLSATKRYKCLGNAVSVPVVSIIIKTLSSARNVKSLLKAGS